MAAWLQQPRQPPTRMQQCLTLALLLHVLLVLVFGNTQGGTAPAGEGVWGRINVTLRGPRLEAGSGEAGTGVPQQTGPVGLARQTRHGGSVRPEVPRETGPGAARLGDWNPTPAAQEMEQTGQDQARPVEGPKPAPELTPAAAPMPKSVPAPDPAPALERLPEPMALPSPDPTPLPEPLAARALNRLREAAPPVNRARAELIPLQSSAEAAPLASLPAQAPVAFVPPVQTRSLPAASSRLSRATAQDLSPTQPLPAPAQTVQPLPAFEPVTAPVRTRQLPPPNPAALTAPTRSEALPLPPQRAPVEAAAALPQLPALPVNNPQIGGVPNTAISDAKAEPAAAQVQSSPSPSAQAADSSAARSPEAGAQTQAKPSASPNNPVHAPPASSNGSNAQPGSPATATPASSSRPGQGAPDAGAQLGHDVATPASTPPDAPRLNLNLPRDMRGGALPSRSSSGLLNMVPPPPERKSKLEESMEAAGKKDCRKAYGEQMGLLAVIPLAADAVRKNGCKW
ncbi:hypothetical protein [Kinneretia aquatilis]|nr:hypothetical protein [Paucibacter aquatile]